MEWWSIEKYQISSTKLQTNLKFQYSMTKTQNRFGISVIVICPSTWLRVVSLSNHLIFVICYLEFLFLQYFSTPQQLAIYTGKAMQP
jgi:hypothetical protein